MVKLALIGLGPMGKNYLNTLISFKNARITHLCSKTMQTLSSYPNKFSKTTDYKSIIKDKVDGVIIATPASSHFEIVSFFLRNNIPLLIEKPLTTNYQKALDLLKLHRNGTVLVGHTLLYHPAYQKLKKSLPKIGQVKKVVFVGANNNPRTDTSLIYDWGPHPISLFLDLFNESPEKIKVIGSKTHQTYVFLELNFQLDFPNGCQGFIKIAWNSKQKKRQLIAEGTKGILVFDDFVPYKLTLNSQPLKYDLTSPLKLEVEDFLKVLKGNGKPQSDLKFAVEVIGVLDRLEKSTQPNFNSN